MSRISLWTWRTPAGLAAVVMLILVATTMGYAQTASLQANLAVRPLTPYEIATYNLASTTETSGGLTTVGIGQPAYLEAQVTNTWSASDISGVVWTMNTKPEGSKAGIGTSPLGMNIPVYEPSDRLTTQVAGRALLRPDVTGVYEVSATITTHSGPTATVSMTIVAGTYVGIAACSKCHNTGPAEKMVPSWSTTLHSQIFTSEMTGSAGDASYSSSCWQCHTVGFDTTATVPNGGFSSLMSQLNWTAPAAASPAAWTGMPAALQNVANIQCENCHGAGSEHANSGGTTWAITASMTSGDCAQCHDDPTHHYKSTEWDVSMHAVTTTDPAGNATCVGCHTSFGFIARMTGNPNPNTAYGAINCQTCHEPHGQTTPTTANHILRNTAPVTLNDGTQVTNAGEGALCMQCHQARETANTYAATTAGNAHFGPHEGPQADMLEGTNGYNYGQIIPSSAHAYVTQDTCVQCHMQATTVGTPAFLNAGGHTFKTDFTPTGSSTPVQLVAACQGCHGPEITTFNFPLFDYNGDGKIDGVQTEVQELLDQLSSMLPGGNGKPQTALNIDATWTQPQLEAAYNWLFVTNDGSKGIHNTAYAVGLIKASIEDLGKHQ